MLHDPLTELNVDELQQLKKTFMDILTMNGEEIQKLEKNQETTSMYM